VRNAQLKTHDTFVKGHPDGSPFNDTPITLLIDLQIRSTCVKTLSKKKKNWFIKKKGETCPRKSKLPGGNDVLEPTFSGSFSSMHSSIHAQRESKRCSFP